MNTQPLNAFGSLGIQLMLSHVRNVFVEFLSFLKYSSSIVRLCIKTNDGPNS